MVTFNDSQQSLVIIDLLNSGVFRHLQIDTEKISLKTMLKDFTLSLWIQTIVNCVSLIFINTSIYRVDLISNFIFMTDF
jgi:hypothetical protein